MPSLKEHCFNSRKRTGYSYYKLHKWMDSQESGLGVDHRRERHDLSYIPSVIKLFGSNHVQEFLFHISEDYYSSALKWNKRQKKVFWKKIF